MDKPKEQNKLNNELSPKCFISFFLRVKKIGEMFLVFNNNCGDVA
jgi:hypothetical protein